MSRVGAVKVVKAVKAVKGTLMTVEAAKAAVKTVGSRRAVRSLCCAAVVAHPVLCRSGGVITAVAVAVAAVAAVRV